MQGGAIAIAWDRLPGSRTLRLLVGGRPGFPPVQSDSAAGGEVPVLYPPGSRGRLLESGSLLRQWQALPAWLRCTGRSDPLWTAGGDAATAVPGPGVVSRTTWRTWPMVVLGGWCWPNPPAPRRWPRS
ncbi:hypothetical protein [Fodinicola feengrottensis]|uniref:hypothetical protein n=1 Tax=Fodinicola feengrottensis TaxID=435914 RepID=UPI0013CF4944|nr:hypothetical protein [Fodinicola feengrottensis]